MKCRRYIKYEKREGKTFACLKENYRDLKTGKIKTETVVEFGIITQPVSFTMLEMINKMDWKYKYADRCLKRITEAIKDTEKKRKEKKETVKEKKEKEEMLWKKAKIVVPSKNKHVMSIKYLVEIGKKIGHYTYGDISNGRFLASIIPVPSENKRRVKKIDVLWFTKNKIRYAFEIENSGTIINALIRGYSIPYRGAKRIIISPKKHKERVFAAFSRPEIKQIGINSWNFLSFERLEMFYVRSKNKTKISQKDFGKNIINTPRGR